ncbi:hypothetical protein NDI43_21370 [Microcoleus vaginatus GB2-A3]
MTPGGEIEGAGWVRGTQAAVKVSCKRFLKTKNPDGRLPKPLLACERMALLVRLLCLLPSIELVSIFFDSAIQSALVHCPLDPQKSQS